MKRLAALLACTAWHLVSGAGASETLPPAAQNLVLSAPIQSWDEALPLGNGLLGGLLWGEVCNFACASRAGALATPP